MASFLWGIVNSFSEREVHDECGVFGVYNNPEAANLTYLGLYGLQHRGQECAGIVSSDGEKFYMHRKRGLVNDVFHQKALNALKGDVAIGHVRYSTTGSNSKVNIQPVMAQYWDGEVAVAHNGNITNANELRHELEHQGAIFNTSMDTEIVIHEIAKSNNRNFLESFTEALRKFKGAYSMVALKGRMMIAARDPRGFRPLVLGKMHDGCWVVASETCSFDIMGAKFVRDVEPGEMLVVDENGLRSLFPFTKMKPKFCVFEYVYVSRPDSTINGYSVYERRFNMGRQLARETHVDADLVVPIPDSANVAALGYAQESGIPYQAGLIRSHYVGRTFIEPDQKIRDFGVKIKINAVKPILEGKRVILVDDSIVRGTTSRKIVKMVREQGGAKEVHVRVSSPPWKFPCYFGIDTPSKSELIGSQMSAEEVGKHIGADSIGYISEEGLMAGFDKPNEYCRACFNGRYPGGHPGQLKKNMFENEITV